MNREKLSTKASSASSFDLYHWLFVRLPAQYRRQDAILHLVVLFTLIVAIAVYAFNAMTANYQSLPLPSQLVSAVPGAVIVWVVGTLLHAKHPRLGLLLSTFSQMFLFVFVLAFALAGFITTPFPLIDHGLLAFDKWFDFSTIALMNETYHASWWVSWLQFTYDAWFWLVVLTPIGLALFNNRREIDRYVLATFISFLIGGLIYYFFPTIAPAGILQDVHFQAGQHELVQRFNEVHHGMALTAIGGGMIAFPSFHVINWLLLLFAWRHYKKIFLLLLLIGLCSIYATMALGYHYLVDVLAAFVVAYISLKLSSKLLGR